MSRILLQQDLLMVLLFIGHLVNERLRFILRVGSVLVGRVGVAVLPLLRIGVMLVAGLEVPLAAVGLVG